jgi:F-type H+-transporting ATPase subunit b
MHFDAEFFVAVGFILFVLLLGYLSIHSKIATALDERSERVANELAAAKRLRGEAEAVLASFKTKAAAAEAEAAAIVSQARIEAEALAKEAATRLEDFVARRTKQAENKIAMAEAQATADVRAAAADAAASAAEIVLRTEVKGTAAADLLSKDIAALGRQLGG